jgi:hypothetical protein
VAKKEKLTGLSSFEHCFIAKMLFHLIPNMRRLAKIFSVSEAQAGRIVGKSWATHRGR